MAGIQYWMDYVVFFRDQAEYEFALSVAGGYTMQITPRAAATLFGIPYPYPSGDMDAIPKGIYFVSVWNPGSEFLFGGHSGIFMDDTVLTKVVPCQPGTPASIWPCPGDGSKDGIFTWTANITRMGGAGVASAPPATAIAQRRFIFGRELGQSGENSASIANTNQLRDASRVIDGFGFGTRGQAFLNSQSIALNTLRPGFVSNTSWERFYIRVRTLPTGGDYGIWKCHGFPSDAAGIGIKLRTSGDLHGYNINAIGTENDIGTIFTPTLGEWIRVDIFLKYDSGVGTTGIVKIHINGTLVFSFTDSAGFGINAGSRHVRTELGRWNGVTEPNAIIDFDDWINADLPGFIDPSTLLSNGNDLSIDWLLGSHIRIHKCITGGASQTNWAPAGAGNGVFNQVDTPETRLGTSIVNTTTASATIEALVDALDQATMDTIFQTLGVVAAIVSMFSTTSDNSDGTLGYRIAGGAAVLTTVDQTSAGAYQKNLYIPSGMILPTEVFPLSAVHQKAANAATDTNMYLSIAAEYIGVWGPEDDPLFDFPVSRLTFLHNCRYANSIWGYVGNQPAAPAVAVGGTYVGNGTYQEITLPAPCHFLWIRGTSGSSGGIKCFGAGLASNFGAKDRVVPNVRMWYDFINQVYKFSVTGAASSECNVNTTTYQYIAFCDPGMRFCLAGEFAHGASEATGLSNPLIAGSGFTPIASFFQAQNIGSVSNVLGLWYRGAGHAGNAGSGLDGSFSANVANFSAGAINSFASIQNNLGVNYLAIRTADTGGVCSGVMLQVCQYTGDGNASKNVTLTPTSGRFPLFVMVCRADAGSAAFFRDPSHTSTNSANVDTLANSTTAITATAIDQITVGSTLNINGAIYSVFVICGDTAGQNNGTFFSTYCDGTGPYVPPSLPTGDINVLGNGGIDFDGTTPLTLLKDVSGIYTLITGKRNDTLIDRQTGQPSVDTKIPDPTFKTGYIGG